MTTHQEALEAGEETPAQEFSRLVIEFNEGERQNRTEAWNLIADFACEHADAIIRGFRAADTITAQAAEIEQQRRLIDGIDEERRSALELCVQRNKEITALEALLDKAVETLEPFAGVADLVDIETEGFSDTDAFELMFEDHPFDRFTLAHFRAARSTIEDIRRVRAMEFRVGGDPITVAAKQTLRELEQEARNAGN